MAGNTAPIFSRNGNIASTTPAGSTPMGTGGAAFSGSDYNGNTAATCLLAFTADATNGSFVSKLRFKALGTNVAAVARIFINNGSSQTVTTNNFFYGELSLPVTTASTSAATIDLEYPLNIILPAGYKIYVGVTACAAGWVATAIAGNY